MVVFLYVLALQPIPGVPCLLPYDNWDGLQPPFSNPELDKGKEMDGWMDFRVTYNQALSWSLYLKSKFSIILVPKQLSLI